MCVNGASSAVEIMMRRDLLGDDTSERADFFHCY